MEDSKNNYSDESYVTDGHGDAGDGTEKDMEQILLNQWKNYFIQYYRKIETRTFPRYTDQARREIVSKRTTSIIFKDRMIDGGNYQKHRSIESDLIRLPLPASSFDASDDEDRMIVDEFYINSRGWNFCSGNQFYLTENFSTHQREKME